MDNYTKEQAGEEASRDVTPHIVPSEVTPLGQDATNQEGEVIRVASDHERLEAILNAAGQQRRGHDPERAGAPLAPTVPTDSRICTEAIDKRWSLFPHLQASRSQLADPCTLEQMRSYQRNIENFVGTVKLPVGLAGPLRVNGLFARGDYYVPLATTEAALVASYDRGARAISSAGGCTAAVVDEAVGRSPSFAFDDLQDALEFARWSARQVDRFKEVAATTSRFGRLIDMKMNVEGNHVYLLFEFTTGDAAGQNMVTFATAAICSYIVQETPVTPRRFFLEANMSGDKKATAQSYLTTRGKKVTAEVLLPAAVVKENLHTTAPALNEMWRSCAIGGILSGTVGAQGHVANALAALFIACGQDAACVSEAAAGITRFELVASGDLYAAITLPNLIVGTVGGGTSLPSQKACLDLLGVSGPGGARAFAEICAATALGGELSLAAAICQGAFAEAHSTLARGREIELTQPVLEAARG